MNKHRIVVGITLGAAATLIAAPAANATSAAPPPPIQSETDAGYIVTSLPQHTATSVESRWIQASIDCSHSGNRIDQLVSLNRNDGDFDDVAAATYGSCDKPDTPVTYHALFDSPDGAAEINKTVAPGDKFYGKVTSDGKGNYTQYLRNETRGWDSTAHTTSRTDINDAEVITEAFTPEGFAANDGPPMPKFDPVTMSGNLVDDKQLATFNPTKSIVVDDDGKTVADTSGIDADGSFTVTRQG